MDRLPETNKGVVTSWIPVASAHPDQAGCSDYMWKYVPETLAAWDPGYGVEVKRDATCLPREATAWWLQERALPQNTETVYSLGPVTCPQAYYTATKSVQDASSTYVACCPLNYDFIKFQANGATGECTSELKVGDSVTYAERESGSWKITTSSVSTSTNVAGIQVNGWTFATATGSSGDGTSGCAASATQDVGNSTCGLGNQPSGATAAGIGIGVGLGVAGLAALGASLFMYYKARKAARPRHSESIEKFGGGTGSDPGVPGVGRASTTVRSQGHSTHSMDAREHTNSPDRPELQGYESARWGPSIPSSTSYSPLQYSNAPLHPHVQPHPNTQMIPLGEMEGAPSRDRDQRVGRTELEGQADGNVQVPLTSPLFRGLDERTRMELEGEFDRSAKVSLASPWVATAKPIPPSTTTPWSREPLY
ncbi:hypothetical protein F5B20DRAFT_535628 [Whalleya microplaca]|nr:hypothetical protein F5B20DRAFT_535628 [Whalleya microplaca]